MSRQSVHAHMVDVTDDAYDKSRVSSSLEHTLACLKRVS